jgi:hypothetical protein
MKAIAIAAVIAASFLPPLDAGAESPKAPPTAGEEHEITRSYETSQETSDGSSGSSGGRTAVVERVIGVRDGGLELEYDLPNDATAEERAREWQLPARVLKPPSGPMLLLNRAELEARLERWLEAAEWTRAVCGRWIFTWNAFRIECDPESVIETIEEYDLRSVDLRDGAPYREAEARGSGTLARIADGPDGARFAVTLEVDPDAVRRARAESDVAVGEIMQQPVTLDAALRERARETVSGTIEVTFEADVTGNARRRTKVTRLQIVGPGGRRETETVSETVERRRVSGPAAHQ